MSGWVARAADGTERQISSANAQSAVDKRRALRVGRSVIRLLAPGENPALVLQAEAVRIAAERQAETIEKVPSSDETFMLLMALNKLVNKKKYKGLLG